MKSRLVPKPIEGSTEARQTALLSRLRELPAHERDAVLREDPETRLAARLWPHHMSGMDRFKHRDFLQAEHEREHPDLSRSIKDASEAMAVLEDVTMAVARSADSER